MTSPANSSLSALATNQRNTSPRFSGRYTDGLNIDHIRDHDVASQAKQIQSDMFTALAANRITESNDPFQALLPGPRHINFNKAKNDLMTLLKDSELMPEGKLEFLLPAADTLKQVTDLSSINLSDMVIRTEQGEPIDLSEKSLRTSMLQGVDLEGANLSSTNLTWSNLQDANLKNANLSGAIVSEDMFYTGRSNFKNADLRGANLENSTWEMADVDNADFKGATVKNADFKDVPSLKNARNFHKTFEASNYNSLKQSEKRIALDKSAKKAWKFPIFNAAILSGSTEQKRLNDIEVVCFKSEKELETNNKKRSHDETQELDFQSPTKKKKL